jgi:hypothetical protein
MRVALALFLVLALAGCARKREASAPGADTTAAAPDTTPPANPADAVRKYYAYLEAKDYPRAYAMWGLDGLASKQTYAEFVDGFAHTAHTSVTVTDPVSIEGAAGSSYAEVRVRVDATTRDGTTQRFGGAYVVRRVNDVPGATPAQLRWHFDSARLDSLP